MCLLRNALSEMYQSVHLFNLDLRYFSKLKAVYYLLFCKYSLNINLRVVFPLVVLKYFSLLFASFIFLYAS